jgi:ABC-type nitrate/sulfonate/bicarbonate transport system substrate-binding protein
MQNGIELTFGYCREFVAVPDSLRIKLPEVILSTQRLAFKVALRHSIRVLTIFSFLWLNRGNSYAADKIVADFGGLGAFQSTSWVAKDLKIFDKYGLDVDLVMITGGARSVAGLLGGSTQFSTGSATTPILASARSSEVAIIAAAYNHFPFSFVSKP